MFKKIQHIHFVGIGGIGMSGIAEVLINLGYRVSGSDLRETEITRRLQSLGGEIHVGHRAENVLGANVVVTSSAVNQSNPEVISANENGIPIIPRAEMLAELMRLKYGIAVAGAHGKTTTTSMVASVVAEGGLDPTVVIGGKLNSLGSNAKLGQGEFLVAEADESDGSFLKLTPAIVVVTNIDKEHLDHYGDMKQIREAFLSFINKVPFYGAAILCLDQPYIQGLLPLVERRHVTYGLTSQSDLVAKDIRYEGLSSDFEVVYRSESLGRFQVRMPGVHNVYNALAAIAVGLELEIGKNAIRKALREFSGVHRRFQIKGEVAGITVVDDYGHHPTEIMATLKAARECLDRRVVAIFQPHRYSRTRDLMDEFATAFYHADKLFLCDIYAAGEAPIPAITSEGLMYTIRDHGHRDVTYVSRREDLAAAILPALREGDVVLTLGAGDIWKTGEELLALLKEGANAPGAENGA